jgi:hypothetical protein
MIIKSNRVALAAVLAALATESSDFAATVRGCRWHDDRTLTFRSHKTESTP